MVYLDACIDFHNCVFQDKSRDFDWWLHRSLLRPVVVYWHKNRASYKQTALTIFFELGNYDVDHTFHPLL